MPRTIFLKDSFYNTFNAGDNFGDDSNFGDDILLSHYQR